MVTQQESADPLRLDKIHLRMVPSRVGGFLRSKCIATIRAAGRATTYDFAFCDLRQELQPIIP